MLPPGLGKNVPQQKLRVGGARTGPPGTSHLARQRRGELVTSRRLGSLSWRVSQDAESTWPNSVPGGKSPATRPPLDKTKSLETRAVAEPWRASCCAGASTRFHPHTVRIKSCNTRRQLSPEGLRLDPTLAQELPYRLVTAS